MSDPTSSNTSPSPLTFHHHPPPLPLPPPPPSSPSASPSTIREYRKGNWTLHETLILISAKRLDDERRYPGLGGATTGATSPGGRPAEQRWKWIENYCWKNGCHRSQNQCNDKWDNLLRDYKKVRDYESRVVSGDDQSAGNLNKVDFPSYWTMERLERKERNLPTNLAQEVFQALTDVLGRRAARRALPLALLPPPPPVPLGTTSVTTAKLSPSASASPSPRPIQTTPPIRRPANPPPPPAVPVSQPSGSAMFEDAMELSASSDSTDDDEGTEPAPKRRRLKHLGSSVVQSATVLARTMLECEEKRERRHREIVELEERRLRIEEQHAELHRQGFTGLISAVNNLSSAIHALVSDHRNRDTR